MKTLLYLLLFMSFSSFVKADNFLKAMLFYLDGKKVSGFARFPKEPSSEHILYKSSEDGKSEKVASADLKSITYYFEDNTEMEMERIATWQYTLKKTRKILPPAWFTVFNRGYVTLYGTTVGGSVVQGPRGASITPSDTYCFVKKESESEGTLIHYKINATISVNKNKTFQLMGEEYFADYPELAAKIKNKEYTYEDLVEVVDVYNAWIKNNGNQ